MSTKISQSRMKAALSRFFRDPVALIGTAGIVFLLFPALYAPFIATGKPWLFTGRTGEVFSPFWRAFFAPESSEVLVDKFFNFLALYLPLSLLVIFLCRTRKILRKILLVLPALALLAAFIFTEPVMDKNDYRRAGCRITALIPYGPDEIVSTPYAAPGNGHLLGCDDVGRDLAARLIYGARVSLAVGILSTLLAVVIGLFVGMSAGFFRGRFDLLLMRLVEIMLCFPTFLLLLILMSLLGDYKIAESIPLVILVIGLTGWINLAFLVRGETLKESSLPYIKSCIVAGVPWWKILFKHLLPNISAPVLISFTFGIAGAIIGESGLSFLGFGVQPPTASWGNLLRQAFDDPLEYWHLTFFPGAALFIAVMSFNFTGEALRRVFDVRGN